MPIFSSPAVGSVFSRTGNVVAAPGDYTAAQVTNAADKSSASIQSFVSELLSPALEASGIGGLGVTRLVGSGTAAPTSGTWLTGDYVIDYTNKQIYACALGGTPGTWVTLGGAIAPVLTYYSGTLAADVTLVGGVQQTIMTTPSLATGTYLVTVTGCSSSGGVPPAIWIQQNTAVASFTGAQGMSGGSANVNRITGAFNCIADITSAGTLEVEALCGGAAAVYADAEAGAYPGTAYTIVKIG